MRDTSHTVVKKMQNSSLDYAYTPLLNADPTIRIQMLLPAKGPYIAPSRTSCFWKLRPLQLCRTRGVVLNNVKRSASTGKGPVRLNLTILNAASTA